MKRSRRYRHSAEIELHRAACWYDSERKGLGAKFRKAVTAQVRRLAVHPHDWPEVGDNVRRSPVPGWNSYSILYEVHDDHIHVLSVFHASREPKDW